MQPVHAVTERTHVAERAAVGRLKRRAEFLHVAKGRRWHGAAMTIQAAVRADDAQDKAQDNGRSRFGFTLTKKVGNAVVRNRARRRLREVVRLADDLPVEADHDYVIVGRIDALRLPFDALQRELARGVASVHQSGKARGEIGGRRRPGAAGDDEPAARTAPQRIRPRP